jgi:putative membrane protein
MSLKRGVEAPEALDPQHARLAEKLSRMRGAEFDRAYMRDMVKDHKKAVAMFESEAKNGQDPQLKEFAAKCLPTQKEHLRLAEEITGEKSEGGRSNR